VCIDGPRNTQVMCPKCLVESIKGSLHSSHECDILFVTLTKLLRINQE
jgi:hypothetical protein